MAVQKKSYSTINTAYEDFIVDNHRYNVLFGSAGCFDSETLINTSLGYKRIVDVSIGDMVLSFNEKYQIPEYKKVIDKFSYFSSNLGQDVLEVVNGDTFFICTENHKFYFNGEWIPLKELIRKRNIISETSGYCNFENRKHYLDEEFGTYSHEISYFDLDNINLKNPQLVYDLQVEDNHNYCITTDNIIVHNSGKSNAASQKIILRCINEIGTEEDPFRHIITVVRKYKTTLRGTVFEQIKGELIRMGISDMVTINESYGVFKFWNGAEIRCIGLDDPEKIKSLVSTSCWIEEATELEEGDFSQLDLRFRGESQYYKQLILTFNPVNEAHWIKRRFFDSPQNGFTYTLHTTYKDNYFIDAQYKKLLEEQYIFDENLYRIYVKGEWGRIKTGSEFYFNFKFDRHVHNIVYKNGLPLHISFDFNINPFITAIVTQIEKRDVDNGQGGFKPYYFVNIIDEFALPNPYNTTERLCDDIVLKYAHEMKNSIYVYGDASGNSRSTRSNVSDYDIIENILGKYMGNYSMRIPKANPLIRKRRWFINKMLFGGFNIELSISPKCKKLIGDLENCIESEDGGIHKQTARDGISGVVYEKYGHHADAMSYLLCAAFESHYDTFM